ncbi:DMT family transporter [Pseudomonas gingeri]|uniref:DMT family transporter n=1 Tax=Pseudomonas gingeri TaxID=117681 RepID=A0A7Y7YHE0_9PSED|nr:DMT family transporter [Pseudomonas gingeri]NWA04675.1 DMT family transporter [Pseudomonas gingeri]NWA14011.1 DMT family transporter [Pseudomonas gingeri]NWA59133.1 DMT family transporter [Pseudomonas gingeri]NWA99442.1 DMT family transporter [Pseudomonas gingeri]NWB05816.1 DMT family transporter [Pseudomonas gingeri]
MPGQTALISDLPAHRRELHYGIACGSIAAIIWGAFLAVSRHGMGVGLHAADLAFIRYAVAGLLLLPWLLGHSPRTLAGIGWRRGILLSLLAGPLFILIGASGYLFAPLAHGAVIQLGVLTLMSVCLAALLLRERLKRSRIIGLCIIIAGLMSIAGPGLLAAHSRAWIGDLLFALAGSMFAVFTILMRSWKLNAFATTAAVSVLSAVVYSPLYIIAIGTQRLSAAPIALLIEQGVVQGLLSGIVALFAFARAVHYLGAGRAALFPALAPAVAILLGVPLVGELPTTGQWCGLAICTLGLLIALRGGATRAR